MVHEPATLGSVVVPLDGSELAERAVPVAEHIARATAAPLLLVRVVPISDWTSARSGYLLAPHLYQQIMDEEDRGARTYVDRIAGQLRASGDLTVHTLAVRGEVASTLIDLKPTPPVGLVVIASHGRTGMMRFALGSVTDRVVRGGIAPVLVVRPFGEDARQSRLERALVPLDGSALGEGSLDMVRLLAGSVVKQVTLARVVDPGGVGGESAEAQRYLEEVRGRLVSELAVAECVVEVAVLHGKAAEQILDRAHEVDVVIMATHGASAAVRWALGSVADRVVHAAHVPVLLVRPGNAHSGAPSGT